MVLEIKMPVTVYRGKECIASGELLPNGAALALTVNDGEKLNLLDYSVDTRVVEEKIPVTFFFGNKEVAAGELIQSGSNICLCPNADTSFNLMEPNSTAKLYLLPDGSAAELKIEHGH